MIDLTRNYWFFISKDVYVSSDKKGAMLLYHTKNGDYIEIADLICLDLVNSVYEPVNLGVIVLGSKFTENEHCIAFIDTVIEKSIGGIIEIKADIPKPINLLPILNLQNDVDKLIKNGDHNLVGEGLIDYLTEVNIYINSTCNQSCQLCNMYYKQVKSCFKTKNDDFLPLNAIENILVQATSSSTKKINVMGGNVFLYPFWSELNSLIQNFDYEYHFWINYQNLTETTLNECMVLQNYMDILITFPINNSKLKEIVTSYQKNKNVKLHFLIESAEHYEMATEIIKKHTDIVTDIIPVYNKNNCSFFEENIYLEKEDIFSETISMRKIFCNQKINSNDFGSLTVLANGNINANINANSLGNITNNSLLDIIYKEMMGNTAWRKVRAGQKCSECLYQFLCPSPSNYELVIDKSNLCHI